MNRRAWLNGAIALMGIVAINDPVKAQDIGLRVVGVAQNDVLNIREYPSSQSRILDIVPPNGRGLIYLSERYGDWVFIQYGATKGWVSQRFVIPEVAGWVSRGQRGE